MKIREEVVKAISTFCYTGYLPLIPGTFGSIAALLVYGIVRNNLLSLSLCTVIITILGFIFSGEAEVLFKKKDASYIVIDEVSGMLLSLLFLPYDIRLVIIAFFIFRLLDTLKPFPAGRLQDLKGGPGVMMDDIVAGLYTNIILQLVLRLASFKTS